MERNTSTSHIPGWGLQFSTSSLYICHPTRTESWPYLRPLHGLQSWHPKGRDLKHTIDHSSTLTQDTFHALQNLPRMALVQSDCHVSGKPPRPRLRVACPQVTWQAGGRARRDARPPNLCSMTQGRGGQRKVGTEVLAALLPASRPQIPWASGWGPVLDQASVPFGS